METGITTHRDVLWPHTHTNPVLTYSHTNTSSFRAAQGLVMTLAVRLCFRKEVSTHLCGCNRLDRSQEINPRSEWEDALNKTKKLYMIIKKWSISVLLTLCRHATILLVIMNNYNTWQCWKPMEDWKKSSGYVLNNTYLLHICDIVMWNMMVYILGV